MKSSPTPAEARKFLGLIERARAHVEPDRARANPEHAECVLTFLESYLRAAVEPAAPSGQGQEPGS